jgi:hypothetical protein
VAPEPDAATGWATIASSPLSPRVDAVAVWTGAEVLVLGGHENLCHPAADCFQAEPTLVDGAAYSPAEDRWRPIADAPSTPTGAAVVVDGTVYVPSTGDTLLGYDVDLDRWTVVIDGSDQQALTPVGAYQDGLLLRGATEGRARLALLHPDTAVVDQLEPPPLPALYDLDVAVVGDRILVFGNVAGGPDSSDADGPNLVVGAAFDPVGGWRRIPDSPIIGNAPMIVAGGLLVDPSPDRSNRYQDGRTYAWGGTFDPDTDRWQELPPNRPAAQWAAGYPPVAAGDEILTTDGLLLDPRAGTWRPVPPPPGPASRIDAAVVWAGDRIFVWGGQSWRDGPGMLLGAGFTYVPG